MDKHLLNKIETIFLVDNLHVMHNGIIASVIRKMGFIEEAWGYKPLILVGNYNIELQRMNIMLRSPGDKPDKTRFSESARILGVYDYFQRSYLPDIDVAKYNLNLKEGESSREIKDNIYEIYSDGKHIRTEYFLGLFGRLRKMEHLLNGKLYKCVYYDDMGCVSMIQQVDIENSDYHPKESYFTTDRRLCMIAEYTYDSENINEKNIIQKITLYDRDGFVVKECASNAELAACCIDEICDDPSRLYLIVDESGKFTPAPLAVKRRNVFRCSVVHNIFLTDAYNLDSPPQSFYAHLCEHRNEFDGIIFLTMTERTDFIKKYPGFDPRKAYVIPHPYPYTIKKIGFESRNHKKAHPGENYSCQ